MPFITLGAKRRSKKPPTPPAPCQAVSIRTREAPASGVSGPRRDEARPGVGFGEYATGIGSGHLHPVLARATPRGDTEVRDRARADPARLDLEVGEGRGKNRGVLGHIGEEPVDHLGRSFDRSLGAHPDRPHVCCLSRAAHRCPVRWAPRPPNRACLGGSLSSRPDAPGGALSFPRCRSSRPVLRSRLALRVFGRRPRGIGAGTPAGARAGPARGNLPPARTWLMGQHAGARNSDGRGAGPRTTLRSPGHRLAAPLACGRLSRDAHRDLGAAMWSSRGICASRLHGAVRPRRGPH